LLLTREEENRLVQRLERLTSLQELRICKSVCRRNWAFA